MNTHKYGPLLVGTIVALAMTGCEPVNDSDSNTTTNPPPSTTAPSTPPPAAPDIDRGTAPTAGDQGMSAEDTRITADIRQAVMSDTAMSASARNCTIITNKGKVTLRGQVDSEMEKNDIEAKARAVAGVTEVDNQLEIKK